jgi:hypothetical protein
MKRPVCFQFQLEGILVTRTGILSHKLSTDVFEQTLASHKFSCETNRIPPRHLPPPKRRKLYQTKIIKVDSIKLFYEVG